MKNEELLVFILTSNFELRTSNCEPRTSHRHHHRPPPAPLPSASPGHGPPAAAHCLNLATNSSCGTETGARLPPGCQPHSTSLSWSTCLISAVKSLPPFFFGSLT